MIKLNPIPRPKELTDIKVEKLTKDFLKDNKKVVWKQPYVKRALLEMSDSKCCYCECRLEIADSYCEIEHFHPKSIYKNEVLVWENLLPSCKRCNGTKSNHDTKLEPIIHPAKENPQTHLTLKAYRLYPKTPLGKTTIHVLDLNNRKKLVSIRAELGFKLIDELEKIVEDIEETPNLSTRKINQIVRTLNNLMQEAIPSSEYSATLATILLTSDSYLIIKKFLQKQDLWSKNFEKLETQALSCQLT
jgi:uncharacterized protein (TIGR02646 family)